MKNELRLASEQLYWRVNVNELSFNSTRDIKPVIQVFGHDNAKQALEFAIECNAPGQNAYVRGLSGSGRKTLVREIFNNLKPKARQQRDYCYVHNFSHPNKPRLIILNGGYGRLLKQMLSSFTDYVVNDLPKTFNSEQIRENRKAVEDKTNQAVAKIYTPFEKQLADNNLALANINDGKQTRMIIAPVYNGKVLTQEEFAQLEQSGELSQAQLATLQTKLPQFQVQLVDIAQSANELIEKSYAEIRQIESDFTRQQLCAHLDAISKKFANKYLDKYLDEIIDDFIESKLHSQDENFNPNMLYDVNILTEPYKSEAAPVIFESAPTLSNLLGAVEIDNQSPAYMNVSAGSLLKADGGYLVLEVDKALAESGTWSTIMRTIRSSQLSIAFEDNSKNRPAVIKPDAIPLDVRVILIGSHQRFYELNAYDGDFADQFKVLVDLENELDKSESSYMQYAHIIRNVVDKEDLLHFNKHAVAQLIEHGARMGSGKQKISARFGRIMDTAREANYLATKAGAELVDKAHIIQAIINHTNRASLPAKSFYNLLERGTIIVATQGFVAGQINGLAVSHAGNVNYGIPARITATVAPGKAGLINIEGQAELSGQIHTKGFQILGGVLRHILKPNHPLSFSASIAFEQSYGGIDGDSASGAEACCLISAMTGVPINQGLSMTGAIDQFGHLQAIGGVNEKIEGFFDSCRFNELTGLQGVIIPKSNVCELMLKPAIIDACEAGKFHIYGVDHVLDALSILTDTESCKTELLNNQAYKANSLLAKAVDQAKTLYQQSKA